VFWKPAFCAHRVWRNSSFYQEVQRSLCDCRDAGFPWTTRLNQILFQVRENCYRMLWNVEDSFWGHKLWVIPKHFSGFPGLRQAELRLMMTNALVNQCPAQRQKWVRECLIIREHHLRTIDEVSMLVGHDQWRNNTWLLHHDNAPAHAALSRRFLTDNNVTVVPHPPYSPDLAPSDFCLFPKLKMKLKGRRFQTEEIQAESQAVLNMLRENDFEECFKNWQRRWDRCQASEGDCFEGDFGP